MEMVLKNLLKLDKRSEDLKHREIKEKEKRDRNNLEVKHALDEQVKTLWFKKKISKDQTSRRNLTA